MVIKLNDLLIINVSFIILNYRYIIRLVVKKVINFNELAHRLIVGCNIKYIVSLLGNI